MSNPALDPCPICNRAIPICRPGEPAVPEVIADLCRRCRGRVVSLARELHGCDPYQAWSSRSIPTTPEEAEAANTALLDARLELGAFYACPPGHQPCANCRSPTMYAVNDEPLCPEGKGCAVKPKPTKRARARRIAPAEATA